MAARQSTIRADRIEYAFVLIFDRNGGVRLTRTPGDLARSERSMSVLATVPISLFETPSLRATINIADQAPEPISIDLKAAGEALRSVIGCDVDIQVAGGNGQ